MIRLFQHLLPNGRAWRLTVDKALRRFFVGLCGLPEGVRDDADQQLWADLDPDTTARLGEWEWQFGLPATAASEADRRLRLRGEWRALVGGQSPSYLQNTLRAAGFDVYVHDWWQLPFAIYAAECGDPAVECGEPSAECGAVIERRQGRTAVYVAESGDPSIACGEPAAECGGILDYIYTGRPIPRNPFEVLTDGATFTGYYLSCGAESAVCGGDQAIVGASASASGRLLVNKGPDVVYNIPTAEDDWRRIVYVGGPEWGQTASVPGDRRDEFEALILKTFPIHRWIGLIVEYD